MTDWFSRSAMGGCLLVFIFAGPVLGQNRSERKAVAPDSIRKIEVRMEASEAGNEPLPELGASVGPLSPLQSRLGPSAVHRLGRMYEEKGRHRRALQVWERGLDTPRFSDSVKVPIADAFLGALNDEGVDKHEKTASQAYELILAQAGSDLPPPVDSLVKLHVAQLTPILPANAKQSIARGSTDESSDTWTLRADAEEQLRRWWRRHDPLPATEKNERLLDHLRRASYARRHFPCENDSCQPAAWDDRGTVYVRFGPPDDRESVTYNDMKFNQDVFRYGVSASASDFPENEVWRYPHIDDSGHYIFAEENGGYQIAKTNDLLPHQLQTGYGGRRERSLNKAVSAMAALRHIYEELALHDNAYAQRYTDIDFYASWQEEQAALVRMGALPDSRVQSVGSGVGQKRTVGPGPGSDPRLPNDYVSDMIQEAKAKDQLAARRRQKNMPTQYSGPKEVESLPVALRSARFLTEAGRTEIRVAWSHPAGAFDVPDETRELLEKHEVGLFDGHLVRLTNVLYDEDYRRDASSEQKYLVERSLSSQGRVDVQSFSARPSDDRFHLRLQWDDRVAIAREANRVQRGPLVKRTVKQLDSLSALRSDADALVMSDLMPGRIQEGNAPRKENLTPYPFSSLNKEERIFLYFELYNLALDEDGRSRYTVEYRVERPKEEGGLFGGEEREETQTELTYQGQSPKTEELVQLDIGEWENLGEGPLSVTVRVTDEVSGTHVERSVQFSSLE